MSWDNYLSHCRSLDGHIGLAPLLPSPFNAGRSHSKAYDIARCGAVGIYSTEGPYKQVILHAKNGMLLANEPQRWIDTILDLCENPARSEGQTSELQSLMRISYAVFCLKKKITKYHTLNTNHQ